MRSAPAKTGGQPAAKAPVGGPEPRPSPGNKKLSFKDQRDLDRLPGEIEKIEAAIAADEQALADPDLYARDPARFAKLMEHIARLRADKDAAELRWLEVAELAEQLAG